MNKHFGGVLVINLDRRPDRWRKIQARLNQLGVQYERVTACDGWIENIQPQSKPESLRLTERHWNPASAGLCLSIMRAIQIAKERKWPSLLIIEDDAEFDPTVNECLDTWMPHVPDDWQLLYLGTSHIRPFADNVAEIKGTPAEGHLVRVQGGNAAHAIGIRASLFDYLLSHLPTLCEPIDSTYRDRIQPQQRSYCFRPHLAWQSTDYSDIMQQYVEYGFLRK